jgi:pyruvate dehydrogenase E2 component (dihydrolipoamide acetyltransferase)
MPISITMPRLSDTMESGTIIKWNVKEGDKVSAGDVIADVETDKATMEMAAYDDGTVAKIAVPEGKAVNIGTVIAVLASEGEDVSEAAKATGNGATAKPAPSKSAKKPSGDHAKQATAASMTEDDSAQPKPASAPTGRSQVAPPPKQQETSREAPQKEGERESQGDGRLRISPVARRMADEHGVDVRSIEGSGPAGRIIKRDVLAAVEAAKETAAAIPPAARGDGTRPQATETPQRDLATRVRQTSPTQVTAFTGIEGRSIQLSGMRQTIARRLVESKTTIPHYQVTMTLSVDSLMDLRSTLNQQLESQGVKLSVNDFVVKACALAMYEHPEFNSSRNSTRAGPVITLTSMQRSILESQSPFRLSVAADWWLQRFAMLIKRACA